VLRIGAKFIPQPPSENVTGERFQNHACRTHQSLLTRFSAMLTSLPKPQDELRQTLHGHHKFKKGTLNCEVAENTFHEMLQAVAPLLDQCTMSTGDNSDEKVRYSGQ